MASLLSSDRSEFDLSMVFESGDQGRFTGSVAGISNCQIKDEGVAESVYISVKVDSIDGERPAAKSEPV